MQDWYLMTENNRPHELCGFENDPYLQYADSFIEVLETNAASNIKIYNSDMTECRDARAIIQDNIANTMLNSLERCGLFLIGTIHAGEYILYHGSYWLVTGYPGNNGVYEKATMSLCQYCIRWQDCNRDIHERWVSLSSASKYDMGENRGIQYTLATNNDIMLVTCDQHTIDLDRKRIFIDMHKENPTIVYKVTRDDGPLYYYGEYGGVLSFILDRTEFNKETDNQELWICDYKSPSGNVAVQEIKAEVKGNDKIQIGFSRTYTAEFKDTDGNPVSAADVQGLAWDVDGVSIDALTLSFPSLGRCKVSCEKNPDAIGTYFRLSVKSDAGVAGDINIKITDIYE